MVRIELVFVSCKILTHICVLSHVFYSLVSGSMPILFNCSFCASGIVSISEINLPISSEDIFFMAAADCAKTSGLVDSSSIIRFISSGVGVEEKRVVDDVSWVVLRWRVGRGLVWKA